MLRWVLVAIAAVPGLAGCGNTDNQVFNGLPATDTVPSALIPDVHSAIHAVTTVTDKSGQKKSVSMFIVADSKNLCGSLAAHPDYFKVPIEPFVALRLTGNADQLGTFHVETSDGSAAFLVTAGPGNPVGEYDADIGIVNVRGFDGRPGGESAGSFDVRMFDAFARAHEIFGKFKTTGCAALSSAQF